VNLLAISSAPWPACDIAETVGGGGRHLRIMSMLRKIRSIVAGVFFLLAGLAGIAGTIYVHGAAWDWWEWTWRLAGSLILAAAGVGSFLPDLSRKATRLHADRYLRLEPEHTDEMLKGYRSSLAASPITAGAMEGIARGHDVTLSHALFHTSSDPSLRFAIVQAVFERMVLVWPAFQRKSMLDGGVDGSHGDPMWLLVRAAWCFYAASTGKSEQYLFEGLADCDRVAARYPHDATPHLVKLLAARVAGHEALLRQGPVGFDSIEQHTIVNAIRHASADDFAPVLARARQLAGQAQDGRDEAYLPAVVHHAIYGALRETERDPAVARGYLARPDVAADLDAAFARTIGSPRYAPSHRALRLLQMTAVLAAERGDAQRALGCLRMAGKTFDRDVWIPFDDDYPARAYLKLRKQVGI
jgi:hypothetical protein